MSKLNNWKEEMNAIEMIVCKFEKKSGYSIGKYGDVIYIYLKEYEGYGLVTGKTLIEECDDCVFIVTELITYQKFDINDIYKFIREKKLNPIPYSYENISRNINCICGLNFDGFGSYNIFGRASNGKFVTDSEYYDDNLYDESAFPGGSNQYFTEEENELIARYIWEHKEEYFSPDLYKDKDKNYFRLLDDDCDTTNHMFEYFITSHNKVSDNYKVIGLLKDTNKIFIVDSSNDAVYGAKWIENLAKIILKEGKIISKE